MGRPVRSPIARTLLRGCAVLCVGIAATAPVPAVAAGKVLFQDSLARASKAFPTYHVAGYTITYEHQAMRVRVHKRKKISSYKIPAHIRLKTPATTPIAVEVTARKNNPDVTGVGVFCRWDKSAYVFFVGPSYWAIVEHHGKTLDVLANGSLQQGFSQTDEHRVRGECSPQAGHMIELNMFIDDTQIGTVSDPTPLPDGSAGVYSEVLPGGTTSDASFRNFVISDLS